MTSPGSLVDGPRPGATAVTVWSLELTAREQVRPSAAAPQPRPVLLRAGRPAPELSAFFYRLVGGPWHWVDRLGWDGAQWLAWVSRPGHHLITCWVDGVPAGYVELDQVGADVEVAHFGLAQQFVGQGLGGWLLTRGLEVAWALPGAGRVWLHTCTLDSPVALRAYEARGLRRYAETVEWRLLAVT